MIFIITPFLQDFKECCLALKIPVSNFNGLPNKTHVRWVNSVTSLYGFSIDEKDAIIYGRNKFKPEIEHNINEEIEIRKRMNALSKRSKHRNTMCEMRGENGED